MYRFTYKLLYVLKKGYIFPKFAINFLYKMIVYCHLYSICRELIFSNKLQLVDIGDQSGGVAHILQIALAALPLLEALPLQDGDPGDPGQQQRHKDGGDDTEVVQRLERGGGRDKESGPENDLAQVVGMADHAPQARVNPPVSEIIV